jgi:hypothetical protein
MADKDDSEIDLDEEALTRIKRRVLTAEKEKLDLDLPRGINNEIEKIITEEVTQ